MKKTVSSLLCCGLLIQSFFSMNATVFATDEILENSVETVSLDLSTFEKLEISTSLSYEGDTSDSDFDYRNKSESSTINETHSSNYQIDATESSAPINEETIEDMQESKALAEGVYGSIGWRLEKDGTLKLGSGTLPELESSIDNQPAWVAYSKDIRRIDLVGKISATAYGAEGLFSNLTYLHTINHLERLDLTQARSIQKLFSYAGLLNIDTTSLDISNIENLSFVFEGINMETLDLSNWDLSKVTTMDNLFLNARIKQLNIQNLDIQENLFDHARIDEILGFEKPEPPVENDAEKMPLEPTDEKEESSQTIANTLTLLDLYGSIINKSYQLFSDESLKTDITNKYDLLDSTIRVTASIVTEDDEIYYLISSRQKKIGYIHQKDVKIATGPQGVYYDYNQYVTIIGTHDIWDGFEWKNKVSSSKYENQTLQARVVYNHFNGPRYLSLYNNKGQWLGYINEEGVRLAVGPQGAYHDYNQYVTIIGTHDIWDG
ncbi:BspA family leucine-rich repeat surface protein, partial [Enterococcus sp.]|uniref:BspA family leucine-rich repeat surface protein n=1 Tax=Enterococcus sp. TaxID=35783 RepID=UPI002FC932CE